MAQGLNTSGFYFKDLWVKELHSFAEEIINAKKKAKTQEVIKLIESLEPYNNDYGKILQSISSRVYSEKLEELAPIIFKMFSKLSMISNIFIDSNFKDKRVAAAALQEILNKHSVLANKSTILRVDSAKIAIKDISSIKETHLTVLGAEEFETKLLEALTEYDEVKEGRTDLVSSLNGAGEKSRTIVVKFLNYIIDEINKQQDLNNAEPTLTKIVQKIIDDYRKRVATRKTLNQKKKEDKK